MSGDIPVIERHRTPVFGVLPVAARTRLSHLFDQLEVALSVRFAAGVDEASAGLVEIVEHGSQFAARHDLPHLMLFRAVRSTGVTTSVSFATRPNLVDQAFAGRTLSHRALEPLPVARGAGAEIGATSTEGALWTRTDAAEFVAGAEELEDGHSLRAKLGTDGFLPIVALVQFVRRHHPAPWRSSAIEAAFLFDDPNLHATRYGYIDFRELAEAGSDEGFHTAFATIPLDTWFASRRAVRLFQSETSALSLIVHGNDHLKRELGETDPHKLDTLMQCALDRVGRFERRHGVALERVMAPPHGACSFEAADALRRFGFEALCVSRPYPWLSGPPADRPLAGWRPTEVVAGGLPVVPRTPFGASERDLCIRAFLRQPIIIYGHHGDVADGLDVLRSMVDIVGSFGVSRWRSVGGILRGLYDHRLEGDVLVVRPHALTTDVDVPRDARWIRVEPHGSFGRVVVRVGGVSTADNGTFEVVNGCRARVELRSEEDVCAVARRPRPALLAYGRRALTEGRDRAQPVLRRRGRRSDA